MRLLLLSLFAASQLAQAQVNPRDSAIQFHNLFMRALPDAVRQQDSAKYLHLTPDQNLIDAWNAGSLSDAMQAAAKSNIESLLQATPADSGERSDIDVILRRKPITMVIVPGIFGEFIKTRAFEDILSLKSSFAKDFKKIVDQALARGDANAKDTTYSLDAMKPVEVALADQAPWYANPLFGETTQGLIQAGSIDDAAGKPLVRVVLLFTPSGSLETLGPLKDRAAVMNQRLQKYLALTGNQDLVLVGYSRGTTYALEMLAQAKKNNLAYLNRVKGMVALGGVIWGSTSADDMTNPNSPMSNTVTATKKLMEELKTGDQYPLASEERNAIVAENFRAYDRFFGVMRANSRPADLSWNSLRTMFEDGPLNSAFGINLMGTNIFLFRTLAKLGLNHMVTEYHDNIRRAKILVQEALTGAGQLSTAERMAWWQDRSLSLPVSPYYYSLTAAVADPDSSAVEKAAFDNPLTYANRSFEDMFLMQTGRDYTKASGVKLNDSQVAVPQAMFLPNVISNTNGNLGPLKTQFLGTLGTHHWGAALRIVFEMRDGRTSPYPRTAMLKALAAKVILDNQQQALR